MVIGPNSGEDRSDCAAGELGVGLVEQTHRLGRGQLAGRQIGLDLLQGSQAALVVVVGRQGPHAEDGSPEGQDDDDTGNDGPPAPLAPSLTALFTHGNSLLQASGAPCLGRPRIADMTDKDLTT